LLGAFSLFAFPAIGHALAGVYCEGPEQKYK
jgi:hypothetical protein